MDTHVADILMRAMHSVRLLGAEVVITGIGAGVAQVPVGLGAEVKDVTTRRNLQDDIDSRRGWWAGARVDEGSRRNLTMQEVNRVGSSGGPRERRSARRFESRHVARLQFVTPLSDPCGTEGAGLWPTLVCRTRDVSESGVALLVPAVREGDENFFGVVGPVKVTLALPRGAVSADAIAVRYERGRAGAGEFLVCVEITETDARAAGHWASHIRSCAPAPPERLS